MEDKSREFAQVKPEVVTKSIEEFSKPQYAVDILKVGVPVSMPHVEGAPGARLAIFACGSKKYFRQATDAACVPFIYLSEGVSNELFDDALQLAAEAEANFSGVLCGRATWKDGVPIYVKEGLGALEKWLNEQGVHNIERVNARLVAARPWFARFASDSNATAFRAGNAGS